MALPGMSRFENRVALVTGGSVGIGAAICQSLVQHGMVVVACSRNTDLIDAKDYAEQEYKGKLHSYKCDVGDEKQVEEMFESLETSFGGVDVLVNNAGSAAFEPLLECDAGKMRNMFNVNVIGLVMCTKLTIKSMMARDVKDGHVIIISSILGVKVKRILHLYSAAQFAISAITQGFRKELYEAKSRIRISSITPGMTRMDFNKATMTLEKEIEKEMFGAAPYLNPEDVANAVLHALSQPEHVQVHNIIVEATGFEP